MMTTECARKLLPLLLKEHDSHMGAFLANCLGLQWQHSLGSFYVWPPVGGFWSHTSTTCSPPYNQRTLLHHFDHSWAQEGTRKRNENQRHRWIAELTSEGHPKSLGTAVVLPDWLPLLYWRTQPPPGTPDWMCGLCY